MVEFIVDSTFGLSKEYAAYHNIRVAGLTLTIGKAEYGEGFSDEWERFYSDYRKSKTPAKTSQPAPTSFAAAISDALEENADAEILILTIGDRLSGTVGSARVAAQSFDGTDIRVVNTGCAAVTAYILLDELIKLRDGGAGVGELETAATELAKRLKVYFIPASMTELARGGRVNKLLSHVGSLLNIKPVFEFAYNSVNVIGKAIGFRRAVAMAIAKTEKFDRLALCYIYDKKFLPQLEERVKREFGIEFPEIVPISPVLGAHVGIGTVGIATLKSV